MANTSTKQNQKSDFGMENQGHSSGSGSSGSGIGDQAKATADNLKDKARQAGDFVRDKAGQAGEYVRDRADQATSSVGKGMENLAGTIRDRGPQSGMMGRATSSVADTLDRTGRYIEDQGLGGMVEDLTSMVRNHPLPALMIGIGVGFLLARLTTSSRS